MEEKVNIQPDEGCGGCSGCGSGGGCSKAGGCGSCGGCDIRSKLHSFNYFEDIPGGYADDDMVEVQFKNTRKGFYVNSTGLPLEIGDMVAVEAAPGHDIGRVSLTGALVRLQMRKAGIKPDAEKKRVFRKAKASDLERFEKAKALENDTMIRARKIASSLQLNMKIGDVEYQGDGNKAIFYYIADERVDFRQLIKVLAETFKVRIEMKQIGARQEAGRIGGIGPCGRPLCCTTWMSNFVSVSTGAARYQDISLNPQKLAGQCAKLKCCLNFEVDSYVEAAKKLPPKDVRLETADNTYYYFKADIFKGEITYSTDKHVPANLVTLTAAEAWDMIARNKAGEKPLTLKEENEKEKKPSEYSDILGQDSLTRFDKKKKKNRSGSQRRKDGKDPKESNSKDPKNAKDSKASKDPKDLKDSKEPKAPKAPKPQQPQREGGEKREQRQGRRGRDGRRPDRQANKPQGSNIQGDNQQPNNPQK
ncbi:MAG: regulatory iron-sulfur-containing complex subunit RicT [bacterium]|jgi:cell fate regulator YaaT (PSP1 superfamily)|nr:regulatory iron-sulfur-containing complex subunit RicT [bacterium]